MSGRRKLISKTKIMEDYNEQVNILLDKIDDLKERNNSLAKLVGRFAEELTTEIDCPDCNGEGSNEVGPQCNKLASECCGGCYVSEKCEGGCDEGVVTLTIGSEGLAQLIEAVRSEDWNGIKGCLNDTYRMNEQYSTKNDLV